jgi:phage-related protein
MTNVGWATFGLIPSAKGLGKAIDGEVLPSADNAGRAGGEKLGTSLVAAAKRYAAPLAAAVGFGALIKTGFEEANDAAAGSAQLAAGIASTGNAANVSVDSLNALASEIQLYSGQTDDSIVASEKLLLTFTSIKNVGPDKIFDRATKATADMAARMGGDASASAVQLGKALNDPIAGISSLSRVGVQFTDSQKDMIKSLVESGDTIGAQNIILGELETQFGGSAAAAGQTFPGQVQILKRSFEDFSQAIIGRVLPSLIPFIAFLSSGLQSATAGVPVVLDFIAGKFGVVRDAIGTVANAFQGQPPTVAMGAWTGPLTTFGAALATMVGGVVTGFQFIRDAISLVAGTISGAGANVDLGPLQGPLIDFGIFLTNVFAQVGPLFQTIGGAVVTAFAPLLPVLAGLLPQLVQLWTTASPLALIFGALAPIIPQLATTLGQLGATLAGALGTALATIVPAIGQLATSVGGVLSTALIAIMPIVVQVATLLAGKLSETIATLTPIIVEIASVLGTVLGSVMTALSPIITMIAETFGQVLTAVSPLVGALVPLISAALQLISPLLQLVGAILPPLIQVLSAVLQPVLALVAPIASLLVPIVSQLANVLTFVANIISTVLTGAINVFTALLAGDFAGAMQASQDTFNGVWSAIQSFFQGTIDNIVGVVQGLVGVFTGVWDNVVGAAERFAGSIAGKISGVIQFFRDLPGNLLSAIGNIGSLLFSVGENIIQGLMDGINNMAAGLADAVLKPIQDAVNGVKGFLGIASPSKLFREIGGFTAQGMALGLTDGAGAIQKASDALIPTAPAYTAPTATAASAAALARQAATAEKARRLESGSSTEVIQIVLDGKVVAESVRKHNRSTK